MFHPLLVPVVEMPDDEVGYEACCRSCQPEASVAVEGEVTYHAGDDAAECQQFAQDKAVRLALQRLHLRGILPSLLLVVFLDVVGYSHRIELCCHNLCSFLICGKDKHLSWKCKRKRLKNRSFSAETRSYHTRNIFSSSEKHSFARHFIFSSSKSGDGDR